MKNKISIIIPIFNSEKKIEKCVLSLENQTYKNIEIILVNDGSTDNSLEVCKKLNKIYNNIKVYSKENGGPSSARNYGLKQSTGELIFFVDSDDYLDNESLEKLIENKKDKSLIGLKHKVVSNNNVIVSKYKNNYNKNEFVSEFLKSNIGGFVWGYLFEKKYISDNIFDINTSLMEDTIFLLNYLKKVKSIKFIDDVYYYYVQSNESITRIIKSNKIIKNIIDIDYSVDKIANILNYEKKYFYKKKYNLFKYEINKIKNVEELKKIINDKEVKLIIKKFIKLNQNFYYKLYFYLLINNIYIILKSEKKIKKIYHKYLKK